MDEQEPAEKFEATDYDEKGNIMLPPPPVVAAKKKRITVAELNKAIDDIKDVQLPETLEWLAELAIRLENIEERTMKHNEALLSDVKTRLDILESGSLADRPDVAADITDRLLALEKVSTEILPAFITDMIKKCDNQDKAIGALANALRSHFEEPAATQPEPAEEIEFAQPPQQPAGGQANTCDIAAVASVCATMADVLMICRALKADPGLIDLERNEILDIACRSSGVIITPGLRIRAGVQFSGA